MIYKANIIGADKPEVQKEWEFMQYTGLKDKNGKEIYEGDILINEHSMKMAVGFNENTGGWLGIVEELEYGGRLIGGFSALESEVIGNIYENPELLEKSI